MSDTQAEPWNTSPSAEERTLVLRNRIMHAQESVLINRAYQHKKGGIYLVDGFDIDTDTGACRVRYHRINGPEFNAILESGITFSRPIEEWTADRFVIIGGER